MRRSLGFMTLGLVLLAACGGDDDDSAASDDGSSGSGAGGRYVEAVAASLQEDTGDGFVLDEEQATCVASGLVESLGGADAIEDAGITPEEFAAAEDAASLDLEVPDDAATELAGTFQDCEITDRLKALVVEGFVSEISSELPPEDTTCLEDSIDAAEMAETFAGVFVDASNQVELDGVVLSAVGSCPGVATEVILSGTGTEVTPEARACVETWITDNTDAVREAFTSGDDAVGEQLGVELGAACPDAFL